jgi:hypothetical protein
MHSNTIFLMAAMLVIPFLFVLIPVILGQRYGSYRRKIKTDLQPESVGSVVGISFGLLAFMLAFTFQIAASRYENRKQLLLDEVTNIRRTYMQAGLLPDPFRSETKKLMVEYVRLRVDLADDPSKLDATVLRSQQILDQLWGYCEILAEKDRSSEIFALYTTSINDLVDSLNHRISVGLEYRIPPSILGILSVVVILSMLALGYQFGITGKGSFRINFLLSLIFAMVMFLVLVLDNPNISKLNQKPLLTLQKQLK